MLLILTVELGFLNINIYNKLWVVSLKKNNPKLLEARQKQISLSSPGVCVISKGLQGLCGWKCSVSLLARGMRN